MIEQDGKENELALFWLPKNCDPENIAVTLQTERADENRKGGRDYSGSSGDIWGALIGAQGTWWGIGDVCCSGGCRAQRDKVLPKEDWK